jgi:TPR repeat protein
LGRTLDHAAYYYEWHINRSHLQLGSGTATDAGAELLWVDALCINQEDLLERALQVVRMGLLYSKIEMVFA